MDAQLTGVWGDLEFREVLAQFKGVKQFIATEDAESYVTSDGEFISISDEEERVLNCVRERTCSDAATNIVKAVASRSENTYYLLTVTGELLAIDIEGTSHLTKENSDVFDIKTSFHTDMPVMIFTQDDFAARNVAKISEVSDLQPLAILRNGDLTDHLPSDHFGPLKGHHVHNIIYVANLRHNIVAINSTGQVLISNGDHFTTVPRLNLLYQISIP